MFPDPGRTLRLAVLPVVVLTGAFAAAAHAAPSDAPISQPLERWGDVHAYTLAAGGDFEGSITWARTGRPTLVRPNNPFNLSGVGATSVRLQGSDTITAPTFLVNATHPTLRFLGRAVDGASFGRSRLVVEVLWSDKGVLKEEVLEEQPDDLHASWAPSKVVPLGDKLPTDSGETHPVRLRFKLKDGIGAWLIDDVYIDPVKRG